jgi:AcrR family transcriptional regulator
MSIIENLPRGRRRDPSLDDAILDATLTMFAEGGYRSVSIEGVAARAGVGKATVYRRYPTKAALVVDALRERLCMVDHLPDTGDLRSDLMGMINPLVDRLHGPDGQMMVAFMAERFREPELAAEFDRSVVGRKREHVRKLLRDAVARGELEATTDVELVAEMMPAVVWYHALSHLPFGHDFAARIVDQLLPTR